MQTLRPCRGVCEFGCQLPFVVRRGLTYWSAAVSSDVLVSFAEPSMYSIRLPRVLDECGVRSPPSAAVESSVQGCTPCPRWNWQCRQQSR